MERLGLVKKERQPRYHLEFQLVDEAHLAKELDGTEAICHPKPFRQRRREVMLRPGPDARLEAAECWRGKAAVDQTNQARETLAEVLDHMINARRLQPTPSK
jgi:hypothetical protein